MSTGWAVLGSTGGCCSALSHRFSLESRLRSQVVFPQSPDPWRENTGLGWCQKRKGKSEVGRDFTKQETGERTETNIATAAHCLSTEQRKGKFPSVRVCKVTLLLQFVTVLMTRLGFQFAYNSVVQVVHACKICYMSIQIKYKNLVWINP